jgi:hypothetical protein
MTKKQLDRIEARGAKLTARMEAIRDGIVADGRSEATDAEHREILNCKQQLDALTMRTKLLTRNHGA